MARSTDSPRGPVRNRLRRRLHGVAASSLVLACVASAGSPAAVDAAVSVPGAPGVQVIPPDEVLASYTFVAPDGAILFTDAEGVTWRLISDPDDPEISNPNVSGFHPANLDAVVATLDALPDDYLWSLDCLVFVLPYPRSGALSSSATAGAIYLSPGVQPLEDGPVLRAMVAHEFGHVVQRNLAPEGSARWVEYRKLRQIEDEATYNATAPHAYRPREIFAEDFRVLCGDPVASGDGTVENPELASPWNDPDLVAFFADLPGLGPTAALHESRRAQDLSLYPNPLPASAALHVRWTSPAGESPALASRADLVDVSGRSVGTVDLVAEGSGVFRAASGSFAGLESGAYWLVLRTAGAAPRAVSFRLLP